MKKKITAHALRRLLAYDAATGIFRWKVRRKGWRGIEPGDVAGTPHNRGYLSIRISGRAYLAHRLAWLHVNGRWPAYQIDHINRVKNDNRIDNLRDVTGSINSHNTEMCEGCHKNPSGKWQAYIQIENKMRYLGTHRTRAEAHAIYAAAKRPLLASLA